ncbi:MAG: hypothetical protein JNJ54_29050 [Myxococcaceae bacterium]|nr:hypothetical protein [Myxococcaceae bacterium]
MASTDLATLERKARAGYERALLLRAVVGFAPALVLVVLATWLNRRMTSAAVFGGVLFASGVVALWRGGALRRAVLPGVLSGLLPLGFAIIANRGHFCASGHCSTYCLPACTAGGVLAGVIVSTIARRRGLGLSFLAGASALSMLTGAMGCSCAGASGIVGMVAGFAVGLVPQGLRALVRRR